MTEPRATRLTRLIEKKRQIENSIRQLEQRDKEKQRKAEKGKGIKANSTRGVVGKIFQLSEYRT